MIGRFYDIKDNIKSCIWYKRMKPGWLVDFIISNTYDIKGLKKKMAKKCDKLKENLVDW